MDILVLAEVSSHWSRSEIALLGWFFVIKEIR